MARVLSSSLAFSLNISSHPPVSGVLFLDLQTLREKRSPTEKMMLKRVKMEVEKRAKIRMIRNLALQNDLEPQNQVADRWVWEISPCVLFLAGVVSWQHKTTFVFYGVECCSSVGGAASYLAPLFL